MSAVSAPSRLAAAVVLSTIVPVASAASLAVTNSLIYNDGASKETAGGQTTAVTNGTYGYSHVFPSTDTALPNSQDPYNIYDDYVFTIAGDAPVGVSARLQAGSILWMYGVQVRFYKTGSFDLPALGLPPTGEIQGWSAPQRYMDLDAPNFVTVLALQNLAPGSYVLEVRGVVASNMGGFYSGDLTVGPAVVPVPGALGLFASGALALGAASRRARKK